MRGMKGQWEQEIDWQRTHWNKAKGTTEPEWSAEVHDNTNTEEWQQPEPIQLHCV